MKTTISVSDELFERAETAAQRLNMSRSQLYATALSEYLARREQQSITDRLTTVYSAESSELDPVLHQMQIATLDPRQW